MSREKISEMVVMLFEAKLNNYTAVKVDVWVKILEKSGIPIDMLSVAFDKAVLTENTFPEPANIIAFCKPDHRTESENAWQSVLTHISRKGSDTPIDDVNIARSVKAIGGLHALGQATDSDLVFKRKEFLEQWERVSEKKFVESIAGNSMMKIGDKNA
jgi:hypothetical protein